MSFPILNSGAAMERLQSSTTGIAASKLEWLPITALRPWRAQRAHAFEEADPADRRQHRALRLHQPGADRRRATRSSPATAASPRPSSSAWTRCPACASSTMSAAEKRAYVLADNKLALNAGWDEEILAEELKGCSAIDLDFDIGLTGFSIPEIDSLIEGLAPEEPGDAGGRLATRLTVRPAAGPGDLWQLGPHRLICGNALDPATVAALMDGERAQMVFTDPPYNVPIAGPCRRPGRHQAPRVRHGVGRDDRGRVHRLPAHGLRAPRRGQPRRLDPLHLHGLAAHGRDARRRPRASMPSSRT